MFRRVDGHAMCRRERRWACAQLAELIALEELHGDVHLDRIDELEFRLSFYEVGPQAHAA